MASAPVLEIDRLLAPIPGENAAGIPPPFDLLRQLDEARKEGDPFGPPRKQDWPLIVQLSTNALTNTSKDMLVAARLTEGITQTKGFGGLRDAIVFLTRLLSECWDRLHPFPEDGEGPDVRGGPLLWLNDTTRGAKFPTTVDDQDTLIHTAQQFVQAFQGMMPHHFSPDLAFFAFVAFVAFAGFFALGAAADDPSITILFQSILPLTQYPPANSCENKIRT